MNLASYNDYKNNKCAIVDELKNFLQNVPDEQIDFIYKAYPVENILMSMVFDSEGAVVVYYKKRYNSDKLDYYYIGENTKSDILDAVCEKIEKNDFITKYKNPAVTDLLREYSNAVNEIKRLEETKSAIINKIYKSVLSDGRTVKDMISTGGSKKLQKFIADTCPIERRDSEYANVIYRREIINKLLMLGK